MNIWIVGPPILRGYYAIQFNDTNDYEVVFAQPTNCGVRIYNISDPENKITIPSSTIKAHIHLPPPPDATIHTLSIKENNS